MIGSAGGVCCQNVKQIILIMSLFVQRQHAHLSLRWMTATILISTEREARSQNDSVWILRVAAVFLDSRVPVKLMVKNNHIYLNYIPFRSWDIFCIGAATRVKAKEFGSKKKPQKQTRYIKNIKILDMWKYGSCCDRVYCKQWLSVVCFCSTQTVFLRCSTLLLINLSLQGGKLIRTSHLK